MRIALLAFAHGVPVITTPAGALGDMVRDDVDELTCVPGSGTLIRSLAGPRTCRLCPRADLGRRLRRGPRGRRPGGSPPADGQPGAGPHQVAERHDHPRGE